MSTLTNSNGIVVGWEAAAVTELRIHSVLGVSGRLVMVRWLWTLIACWITKERSLECTVVCITLTLVHSAVLVG